MLKFRFLKGIELEVINDVFGNEDSEKFDNWDLMTDEEELITDAAMFVDEAYADNCFDSIESFAREVVEEEGDSFESTMSRINSMLDKGILKVVDFKS